MDYKKRVADHSVPESRVTLPHVSGTGERALRPIGFASSAFNVKPALSQFHRPGTSPRLAFASANWVTGGGSGYRRFRTARSVAARTPAASPSASTDSSVPAPPCNALPPEGPPWLYGYVLYDGGTEQLYDLICRNLYDLDQQTSDAVLLTYIGNPREVGLAYDAMRSTRLRRSDEDDARALDLQKKGIGADYARRGEVRELTRLIGITRDQLPCIAFFTRPPWSRPALLRVRPEWILEKTSQFEFGRALVDFFEGNALARLVGECQTNEALTLGFERIINEHMTGRLEMGAMKGLAHGPLLTLDEIKSGESNRSLLARIVGHGRFHGVEKEIGSRELFFISLLFMSERELTVDGECMTVISVSEAVEELLKWRDAGRLKYSGQDADRPAHRVQKMWREFKLQMSKNKELGGLFTDYRRDSNSNKFYALRLRSHEKQIRVHHLGALFPKVTD